MPYPDRPPQFCDQFMTLLLRSQQARRLGTAAAWLLTLIVHQERVAGYAPVSMDRKTLLEVFGAGRDLSHLLTAAIERACRLGWLHVESADDANRNPAYWVTVPAGYELPPVEPAAAGPMGIEPSAVEAMSDQ